MVTGRLIHIPTGRLTMTKGTVEIKKLSYIIQEFVEEDKDEKKKD